jgi:hypothetical protein
MARKQEPAIVLPNDDREFEEHQREVIRLYMRHGGWTRAALGEAIGMPGNLFGVRVQADWRPKKPGEKQPVFKPAELYKIMSVLGIEDANLLFKDVTLKLVPDFGPIKEEKPAKGNAYNRYYHGESVIVSQKAGNDQRIPA